MRCKVTRLHGTWVWAGPRGVGAGAGAGPPTKASKTKTINGGCLLAPPQPVSNPLTPERTRGDLTPTRGPEAGPVPWEAVAKVCWTKTTEEDLRQVSPYPLMEEESTPTQAAEEAMPGSVLEGLAELESACP